MEAAATRAEPPSRRGRRSAAAAPRDDRRGVRSRGLPAGLNSDASTNVTPIATPEAPKRDSRRGSRVPVAPIVQASSRSNQQPSAILGSRASTRSGAPAPSAARGGSGCWSVHAVSASDTAPTHANTTSVPAATATVPSTGPTSVPKIAEASTDPSIWPRCSRGEIAITHARPPAQTQPHAIPWTNRSPSSTDDVGAEPERDDRAGEQQQADDRCAPHPARVAIHAPSSEPGIIPAG